MNEYSMNLDPYIHKDDTALVGRPNGRSLVAALDAKGVRFPDLEAQHNKIVVAIPTRIVSMNRSFFLGAFSERVKALGRQGFVEKYSFQASEHILAKIEKNIDYALKEATQREILNA